MPFYERQPYITPLYQVLLELLRGEIRVPRFQRPGSDIVWTTEQRGDLLDSLYRGFPVGTILLWSTTSQINCWDRVVGFRIPETQLPGRPTRVLLDGHQRLSTLLLVLGSGLSNEVPVAMEDKELVLEGETWVFETRAGYEENESSRDRFIPLRKGQAPTPTQVPLSILLDRVEMNRWMRGEHGRGGTTTLVRQDPSGILKEEEVRNAESVRDKLREYSIPVAVLVAESLDEATESFKRVNSSGTPMGTFHMVQALAYANDFDLANEFQNLKEQHLERGRWKELDDTDLLRICAGLVEDGSPIKFKVESLAKKLKKYPDTLEKAFQACADAGVELARLGIHGPEALPYVWQIITLAVVLGQRASRAPLTEHEQTGLREWFWVTTYGEVFAGVTARYHRARTALEEMLKGKRWLDTTMTRDVAKTVESTWSFNYKTVRSKAFALLLARTYDDSKLDGRGHHALADFGHSALSKISRDALRSDWSKQVLTTEDDELQRLRSYFQQDSQTSTGGAASVVPELLQHGFASEQVSRGLDPALEERKKRLIAMEKAFIEELGLEWRVSP
jgi:hypothetical protein